MFKNRNSILSGIFILMFVFLVGCFGSSGGGSLLKSPSGDIAGTSFFGGSLNYQ
ncbi:MAG: hypothetical protein ABII25_06330 [bacterium]